jgi:hypothetical protein
MRRLRAFFTALAVFALFATQAAARQDYPAAMQKALGLTYTPGCDTCHQSAGGGGPLNNFGSLLVSDGLSTTVDEPSALVALLQTLPQAETDLKTQTNPNDDAQLFAGGALHRPAYGCASIAGSGTSSGWAGLLAIFALFRTASARRTKRAA